MRLESIRLKNFKAFRDVTFDRLPEFCVLVGANGTGKSTLFDVFRFLKDALTYDLGEALYRLGGPRGFDDVRSRDSEGPIEIELTFQHSIGTISYSLAFDKIDGKTVILRETISVHCENDLDSSVAMEFKKGIGHAAIIDPLKQDVSVENIKLQSPDTLALKLFMLQADYPLAVELWEFLKNHHISDFNIQRSRLEENADFSAHLSQDGNNLAIIAERLYTQHSDVFKSILERLKIWIPGVSNVEAKIDEGGRVYLRVQDGSFKDPFRPENISDGTFGIFAHLVLLHDPNPHPLLCVEEPEHQIYQGLLEELAGEYRYYSVRGGQVMVSTHSPEFLNGCRADEVFWLEKRNGYTHAFRAKDDQQIAAYVEDGVDKMGYLWKQGYFGKADPA